MYLLRTADCSKCAIAVSFGQKVVLSFNDYWGKGKSNLWLNLRMLPSLGSVVIQLGTCKLPGIGIHAFGAICYALCICGTLGKGTLCMCPSFRVPTHPFRVLGFIALGSFKGEFVSCK